MHFYFHVNGHYCYVLVESIAASEVEVADAKRELP